jgi:hypothetical protein
MALATPRPDRNRGKDQELSTSITPRIEARIGGHLRLNRRSARRSRSRNGDDAPRGSARGWVGSGRPAGHVRHAERASSDRLRRTRARTSVRPPQIATHMNELCWAEGLKPLPTSIARCRELLGEDAESMTDQHIDDIRRHAETMACIVVEMRRYDGRTGDRPLGLPGADRLHERAAFNGHEPAAGSGLTRRCEERPGVAAVNRRGIDRRRGRCAAGNRTVPHNRLTSTTRFETSQRSGNAAAYWE